MGRNIRKPASMITVSGNPDGEEFETPPRKLWKKLIAGWGDAG
jgi:hypothetical protein